MLISTLGVCANAKKVWLTKCGKSFVKCQFVNNTTKKTHSHKSTTAVDGKGDEDGASG